MNRVLIRAMLFSAIAPLAIPLFAGSAMAQTTTSSLSGRVTDVNGAAVPGATVMAVNTGTNQTYTAITDAQGNYTFNGLRPAPYRVSVDAAGTPVEVPVQVAIAQSANLDLSAEAPAVAGTVDTIGNEIVVTARGLREVRTSEVATNVSQAQIENLPQTDRNFLSFAALAPGVVYNDSETGKGIQAGASTASQVNVFIDGVSLKNRLREGGIAGQQNSRGNPFGQSAVQEFRVLTQNYKAEYEEAGSAIITAVTKSGTNQFHGEVFGQYTDRSLIEKSIIDERQNNPKPAFTRKQYGAALGGPIIKDKLFFFLDYEGNDQDRAFNVTAGGTPALRAAVLASSGRDPAEFEGAFVSPFRGDFYFGKLTFTPDDFGTIDLTFSRRDETDIQGFGGITSREAAENKRNRVDSYLFKWNYFGDSFVNDFQASFLEYNFNPSSLNPDLPQFEYQGVIIFGGKDSTRNETQRDHTFRDDFTYTGLNNHAIKLGAKLTVSDIEFVNNSFVQPRYTFVTNADQNLDFSFPAEARLGLGNARIAASNTIVGAYIQDDWDITDKLQLNLGLRWDYETNGFNNEYVTPANAAAAIRSVPSTFYFDPENYISGGNNRKPFAGAIAPRVGFSFDVIGDRSLVVFGGYGRYYDRNAFNNTQDELSRSINPVGTFYFSRDGLPRNGQPTVVFDPAYLTRDGLLNLRNTAQTGLPELFAVKNDARPPVNDQFSLGVRKLFGAFEASITGSYQRGRNGYTNLFATRQDGGDGNCCDGDVLAGLRNFGYANLLIGFDGLDTRYKALYVKLDKNYSVSSGWGLNVAYTLSKGEQNGNDLFSLDGTVPDSYGWRPRPGDERHRLVLSGLVDLPLGFQFSTLTTLGSGQAYQVVDATSGFGNGQLVITSRYPEKDCIGGVFAYCEVNFSLAKDVELFNFGKLTAAVDVFNVFNNKNFTGFDGFFNATDPLNPANGEFNEVTQTYNANGLLTLPRRVQFRLRFAF